MVLSRSRSLLAAAAAIAGLSAAGCPWAVAQSSAQLALSSEDPRPNRIQFEYVPPKDPRHEHVYRRVMEGRTLEKVQQLFSPFRLPIDLTDEARSALAERAAQRHDWIGRAGRPDRATTSGP